MKALGSTVFVLILIGLIGVNNVIRHPRFQFFHTVDVVQLLASGMCFGVALSTAIVLLRTRRKAG